MRQIKNLEELKLLLFENGIRYYSVTQNLYPKSGIPDFKVYFEVIHSEISLNIESILDLGYKNIEFNLIDHY